MEGNRRLVPPHLADVEYTLLERRTLTSQVIEYVLRPVRRHALAIVVGLGTAMSLVAAGEAHFPWLGQVLCASLNTPAEDSSAFDEVLNQAEHEFRAGRLDAALVDCRRALGLDSNSARAYYLLGMIQGQRGAHEDATQALLQAVKLNPNHIASRIYLGKLYLAGKNWEAAQVEFHAALRLGDTTGMAQYGLGLAFIAQSRYSEALPHLQAAVEVNGRDPELLFTLVAAELRTRQLVSAETNISRLEGIAGSDPWVLFRLGKLLEERGMSKQADTKFERAIALLTDRPRSEEKLSTLDLEVARLRFDHRDYSSTLGYLDKVEPGTLNASSQADALQLEGSALLALGRVLESRSKLEHAAEIDPEDPHLAYRLVWADVLDGDMKAATAKVDAAREKWPEIPNIQRISAIVQREKSPERAGVPFSAEWHLKGEGLVCCPCKVPCPCRSNGQPTYGHCENTGAFRIDEGHYGDVSLDGVTFVVISSSMNTESDRPSFLYVEPSATDRQLIALERLNQSFNPLVPFLFLNIKRTPISMIKSADGGTFEVKIPGVLEIKIQRQLNARGEPLISTAAVDYFSNTLEYARNLTYKLWDADGKLSSDYSGRQANFRNIDLDYREYQERRMLIEFADSSGFFNDRQMELIKNLKLPTLPSYPE